MTEKQKENIRKNNKRINDRNQRFNKMSVEKQRVAIAEDVLSMIGKKTIRPKTGNYFGMSLKSTRRLLKEGPDKELQKALPLLDTCTVCARGAIFVGVVAATNSCTISEAFNIYGNCKPTYVFDTAVMNEVSNRVFPWAMLAEIETYFEDDCSMPRSVGSLSAIQRMKNIMQNIIDNKGKEFTLVSDMR